ncbi:MAG: reverse gyrase [Candidatus Hadarchaeales archaeon]
MEGLLGATYKGMCPNCGGDIKDSELVNRGVCYRCFSPNGRGLARPGKYAEVLRVEEEVEEFCKFFAMLMDSKPWALQEVWARRVLLKRSFSLVAPTGIGKTHFGLVMALYLAQKGKRSYIVVPTSLLVKHLLDRAEELLKRAGKAAVVLGYYSGMPESEGVLEKIREGEFSVLITTDRFLYTKFDLLHSLNFDFIFVDDVDSFLKSPKNIDKVAFLLGFSSEEVEKALSDEPVEGRRERVLVVSGATLKGKRTKRLRVFRKLLGFEPGFTLEFVRNIANFALRPKRKVEEEVADLVKKYGPGCLVFVPQAKGLEYAEKIAETLEKEGMSVFLYERMSPGMLEKFRKGEYAVLVGIASSRSPLARGLDLPETVRYVVFAGVPRREMKVEVKECNPQKLLVALKALSPLLGERMGKRMASVLSSLSKVIPVRGELIQKLREADEGKTQLEGFAAHLRKVVLEAREILEEAMGDEELRKEVGRLDVEMRMEEGEWVFISPDTDGYLQASGRASRFYAMGISRGVSIVVVDDEKAFSGLSRRLRLLADEEFEEYVPEKVKEEFEKVDRDRETIRRIRRGEVKPEVLDLLRSSLLVVESPTKARTIAYLFGNPAQRTLDGFTFYEVASGQHVLTVVASAGHLFDLTTLEGFHGVRKEDGNYLPVYTDIRRCADCGEQFTDHETCPFCGSANLRTKKETVELLQKLSLEVNEVFIATDPDAEGEKIGYDLYVVLSPYCRNIRRLEFHEVTRKALRKALEEPGGLRPSYVQAQVVRRIEDRWVGFELSRKLWEVFGKRNLSAGRVQTPVLGWVLRQTEELKRKIPVATVRLENGLVLRIQNPEGPPPQEAEVTDLSTREEKVLPPPPYTTDAMLREASQRLGFSASHTMELAQTLFECGLITYHRTDSTRVSIVGMELARKFVEENYPGLSKPREYSKEGAHECIRPTKPLSLQQLRFYLSAGIVRIPQKLGPDHFRLYDLIFRRFIASQMKEARILVQEFKVKVWGKEVRERRVVGIIEEGFLKVHQTLRVEGRVEEGSFRVMETKVRYESSVRPYSQGDLIALMKEKGIGRPSTYSKIIETLFKRGYVFEKGGKLFVTPLGRMVYRYLEERFGRLVSEGLTRDLEETIDAIENGKIHFQDVLKGMEEEVRREISSSGNPVP